MVTMMVVVVGAVPLTYNHDDAEFQQQPKNKTHCPGCQNILEKILDLIIPLVPTSSKFQQEMLNNGISVISDQGHRRDKTSESSPHLQDHHYGLLEGSPALPVYFQDLPKVPNVLDLLFLLPRIFKSQNRTHFHSHPTIVSDVKISSGKSKFKPVVNLKHTKIQPDYLQYGKVRTYPDAEIVPTETLKNTEILQGRLQKVEETDRNAELVPTISQNEARPFTFNLEEYRTVDGKGLSLKQIKIVRQSPVQEKMRPTINKQQPNFDIGYKDSVLRKHDYKPLPPKGDYTSADVLKLSISSKGNTPLSQNYLLGDHHPSVSETENISNKMVYPDFAAKAEAFIKSVLEKIGYEGKPHTSSNFYNIFNLPVDGQETYSQTELDALIGLIYEHLR